ncbi:hypothetical protein LO772_09285 [Yinghuangia sp. ASG 101]|uniref:hypothetical protein n=1 Tax=Yinghuangia sp. ASG 101 TaxID=2896848 RepID=UPI001E608CEE|nr:hypothetical protein [Yinghuangia sp. ASG 101]UGQ15715.1 hypothetical protein LO772_09285 [Yinghuangia sp. ASG 101]
MSERAAPFHCPYCGDEDLRPHEAGHGAWLCGACRRAFTLKFLGLVFAENAPTTSAGSAPDETDALAGEPTSITATTAGKEAT